MAKKKYRPRHLNGFPGYHDSRWPGLNRGLEPVSIHPAALKEELETQRREMERIAAENRRVTDENVILQKELAAAKDETYTLGQVVLKLQADKDARDRELIEMGMNLEAERHASEPLKTEVMQLRAEILDLNTLRLELVTKVQGLMQDNTQVQAENQQMASMRSDTERMHEELLEARRVFEYEKKFKEAEVSQRQRMETNLFYMAHGSERRKLEHLHAERRARGYDILCPPYNYQNGGGVYELLNESPEMRYPGSALGNRYGGAWEVYANHGPL